MNKTGILALRTGVKTVAPLVMMQSHRGIVIQNSSPIIRNERPVLGRNLSLRLKKGCAQGDAGAGKNGNARNLNVTTSAVLVLLLLVLHAMSVAQDTTPATPPPATDSALGDLDTQVRKLRAAIEEMRAENAQSRSEMRELRQELQDARKLLAPLAASSKENATVPPSAAPSQSGGSSSAETSSTSATPANLNDRVQKLEESTQLLGSKIDEQYQTKVETASKYRARLSGIVLMNTFHNVGAVDNLDFPDYARPVNPGDSAASFGATLRQTEIGLEIFGPTVAGAKSTASVEFDFAGGFPATPNGVDFGIARMQTASLRLDWKNDSLIAGQDSLFISPLSPTSFASLAVPALAYAGNLWGWTPQIRLEHRFDLSNQQSVMLQAGILDNLDWEPPVTEFYRAPTVGWYDGLASPHSSASDLVGRVLPGTRSGRIGRWNWPSRSVWWESVFSNNPHTRPRRGRRLEPTEVPTHSQGGAEWGIWAG